jgi:arginyl-tRNA--protein-N-Asp/Glu arginylyltransferase
MRKMNISYDEKCRKEFSVLYDHLRNYFISIDIGCPYGLPHVATFHQATFGPLGERAMELFLAAGYRRNGNCLYDMRCDRCCACIPIRLHPGEFTANRNQRRTWRHNEEVHLSLLPVCATQENLDLCEKFLKSRYPKEYSSAKGYFRDFFLNHIVNSIQLEYRVDDRLVGTCIADIGYNWLNAVYFYFDPDEARRSLGTFNILKLVDICREWEISYLYLGYLIREVQAMSYKAHFLPHYLLQDGQWQRQSR